MTDKPSAHLADAFDAMKKLEDGEPYFLLLGRDPDAEATIKFWCQLRRNRAYKTFGHRKGTRAAKLFEAELVQANEAEAKAEMMGHWHKHHGEDHDAVEAITAKDVAAAEAELAEADELKRKQELVKHLREAAYHLSEFADHISEFLPDHCRVAVQQEILPEVNTLADWAEREMGTVDPRFRKAADSQEVA